MEYSNAFVGKAERPSEAELTAALGKSATVWNEFVAWMANEQRVSDQEWKGVCVKKYGWSLRLKQKRRNIVYLGPGKGCFMVSFVLNDKALKAAKEERLPKAVAQVLAVAPRYPEGNGVRLMVEHSRDLEAIRKITAIKLAS